MSTAETVAIIDAMVRSGRPQYLATANVDFLVQSLEDVELRRILMEAHLVLCDGTPLVWASALLGNALPERVAGSDVVPLLLRLAAEKGYRVFFLGASPTVAARAVTNLKAAHPDLVVAGHYSPPYASLLEIDHDEVRRRISEAKPDLLFVGFGCPKQEKWINMHYRTLGVPVCVGVGGTIDFLAGHLKRAPRWMQKSGTEWIFRMAQEPRRLFRRYVKDLWVFGWEFTAQYWRFRKRMRRTSPAISRSPVGVGRGEGECFPQRRPAYELVKVPSWFDVAAVGRTAEAWARLVAEGRPCLLDLSGISFIDSTGVGALIRFQKQLHRRGSHLLLVAPSAKALRAFALLRLEGVFTCFADEKSAAAFLESRATTCASQAAEGGAGRLVWSGEVTAANADVVWKATQAFLNARNGCDTVLDMSRVSFIDSTGVGLMLRARKWANANGASVTFTGLQPAASNVVRLAKLEGVLLVHAAIPQRSAGPAQPTAAPVAVAP